jgi:hypothetical protein
VGVLVGRLVGLAVGLSVGVVVVAVVAVGVADGLLPPVVVGAGGASLQKPLSRQTKPGVKAAPPAA